MKHLKRILISTCFAASLISTNLLAYSSDSAKHSQYLEQTGMIEYSNVLVSEYKKLADKYANKGYRDIACGFEKKAEAIECGRNKAPECAYTQTKGCTELEAARNLVIQLNNSKNGCHLLKYRCPTLAAKVQAKYDEWTTSHCLGLKCAEHSKTEFYSYYLLLMKKIHQQKCKTEMPFNISSELSSHLKHHNMVAKFHFAFDKYAEPLKKDSHLMTANALIHSYEEGSLIVINGHSCATGNISYNAALAQKRAMTIKQILIENGVKEESIHIVNFGLSNADNLAFDYGKSKFVKAEDIKYIKCTNIRELKDKHADRRVEVFVIKQSCSKNHCNKCMKTKCHKSTCSHRCSNTCSTYNCKTRAYSGNESSLITYKKNTHCSTHRQCGQKCRHVACNANNKSSYECNKPAYYEHSYCTKTECLCKCHKTKKSSNKCSCKARAYAMQVSKIQANNANAEKIKSLRKNHSTNVFDIANHSGQNSLQKNKNHHEEDQNMKATMHHDDADNTGENFEHSKSRKYSRDEHSHKKEMNENEKMHDNEEAYENEDNDFFNF